MPDIKFDGALFGVPVSEEHWKLFQALKKKKNCCHNNETLRAILQEYKEKRWTELTD